MSTDINQKQSCSMPKVSVYLWHIITETFGCFKLGINFHPILGKIQAIFPLGMGPNFGTKNALEKSLAIV